MLSYETILAALVTSGALYLIVSKCRCFIRTSTNGDGELEWGIGFTANDVLINRSESHTEVMKTKSTEKEKDKEQ